MSDDVTLLLEEIGDGDENAAERLLTAVYEELRKLALSNMARERPGQTLQATALVHEAWMRLGGAENSSWKNRGHFFGAAAQAMQADPCRPGTEEGEAAAWGRLATREHSAPLTAIFTVAWGRSSAAPGTSREDRRRLEVYLTRPFDLCG